MENLLEMLKNCSAEIGVVLDEKQLAQMIQYKDLLLEWNEKINLTAITDEKEIVLKHFVDSLTLVPLLQPMTKQHILDVGSGAGFPGLPLAIANPQSQFVLMDGTQKRVRFLEVVISELGLTNVKVIHGRAEELARLPQYREVFDVVTARAVAKLNILAEYCLPYVDLNGFFVAMKGPTVSEEMAEANKIFELLGGRHLETKQVSIPQTDLKHTLVVVRKFRHTPPKFPRNPSKMTKTPIN